MTPGEFAVGPWIQVCHDCRFFLSIQEKYTYWLSHSHLVNKRNYKCNYFKIYSNDILNPQEKAYTGSNSQALIPTLENGCSDSGLTYMGSNSQALIPTLENGCSDSGLTYMAPFN